jgi:hypothetical protein
MTSTYLKPTPRFAQLKQGLAYPTFSVRELSAVQYNLPAPVLFLKSAAPTRIVEICEIVVRSSVCELEVNGSPFDQHHRTEFLMYSEEGVVTITLNQELLLPIANRCMRESPWSFTVRAHSRNGAQFEDSMLLFTLPDFDADSRSPSAHHFEQLLNPGSVTQLKPLEIFAQVVVSHFWSEKDVKFNVYLREDDPDPAFSVEASSSGSYLVPVA